MIPSRWRAGLGPAVVAAAAVVVHAPSIAFGFTDLDDRDLIVDDAAFLAQPSSVLRAFGRGYMQAIDPAHPYYRPVVTASYVLDAQWHGTRPWGYHLTNVVVHAAASALVFLLLRRLGPGRLPAAMAATVFAVHPALGGAVGWVPGRNDALLAVFFIGAWIAFLAYARRPRATAYAAHLGLFAAALGTKETAVALPLVCAATSWLAPGTRATPAPEAARATAHADLFCPRWCALLVGWAACLVVRAAPSVGLLGARAFGHALAVTPADAARAIALLAAMPVPLVLPYDVSLLGAAADAPVVLGAVVVAIGAILVVRSPRMRRSVAALGATAFALTALPALVLAGPSMLASRLYLPAVGACIVLAEALRAAAPEPRTSIAYGAAVAVALAALTVGTERSFRDPMAFARASVDEAPGSALAHECLGAALQRRRAFGAARTEYALALSLGAMPVVHNNLAAIDMAEGRWAEAEAELRAELAIDPSSAAAERNLAIVLSRMADPAEAAPSGGQRADDASGAPGASPAAAGGP